MAIRLCDLVPTGIFVGTSLILRQGRRFLYGIRRPRTDGTRCILELTGIGGGLEEKDPSLTAGVLREVGEEIGCPVRILPCDETVVVRGQGRIERVPLQGAERPAAVVFRRYRTPPHHPWHEQNQGEACLIVFLGELGGEPCPVGELPALIWLPPNLVIETARSDVPLLKLLESGAELVQGETTLLLSDAWARLTDSQEALVLGLADEALAFYASLSPPRPIREAGRANDRQLPHGDS